MCRTRSRGRTPRPTRLPRPSRSRKSAGTGSSGSPPGADRHRRAGPARRPAAPGRRTPQTRRSSRPGRLGENAETALRGNEHGFATRHHAPPHRSCVFGSGFGLGSVTRRARYHLTARHTDRGLQDRGADSLLVRPLLVAVDEIDAEPTILERYEAKARGSLRPGGWNDRIVELRPRVRLAWISTHRNSPKPEGSFRVGIRLRTSEGDRPTTARRRGYREGRMPGRWVGGRGGETGRGLRRR